jgi:hypothetical protein
MWLWQFGRGKPSLGCLTIQETLHRQDAKSVGQESEGDSCGYQGLEMKCELDLYKSVRVHTCTKYVLCTFGYVLCLQKYCLEC